MINDNKDNNWDQDPRTIQLLEDLGNAREVIKLLAEWRFTEDHPQEKDISAVYCEMLH